MFSLTDRQQSLVVAVLLAAVALAAVWHWQDARREGAPSISIHDPR